VTVQDPDEITHSVELNLPSPEAVNDTVSLSVGLTAETVAVQELDAPTAKDVGVQDTTVVVVVVVMANVDGEIVELEVW
jgi:hypothetical protein